MKTFTLYVFLTALFGFATLGCAKIIDWSPCQDGNSTADCTVHQVKIEPCIEADQEGICTIKINHVASITVDFTPNFSGGNLYTRAFWMSPSGHIPLPGMSTHACDWTPCPAAAGTRQIYKYTNLIQPIVPPVTFSVEWKLRNAEDKECCIVFDVKVVKENLPVVYNIVQLI